MFRRFLRCELIELYVGTDLCFMKPTMLNINPMFSFRSFVLVSLVTAGVFAGGYNSAQMAAGMKLGAAASMSEEAEDELGQTVALAATNRWPIYDQPELNKYVTMVGLTVASASNKPDANWYFAVLDTPELGAYSGPGGYVLITRGSIAAMEDESELAAVLAHEIAHVLNKDGFDAVKRSRMNSAGLELAAASDSRLAAFNKESDFLVNTVLTSGWDQSQETKADAGAVKLLIKSGYEPRGLPRFLERMQKQGSRSGKVFGTHPGTADRISRTTSQIGTAKAGATNRERFVMRAAEARL